MEEQVRLDLAYHNLELIVTNHDRNIAELINNKNIY